ncbi:MAG: DUF4190 domain-containing protein [Candidatus Saccharimonadales bacterium]
MALQLQKPLKQPTPRIAIIGLILAFILPPLGFILSIISFFKIKRGALLGKILAIIGIVVGFLLSGVLVFFVFLIFAFGGFHLGSNQAQKDFQPIGAKVESLGATKICDNGDGGHGFDNTQPWYSVYYLVKDSANLDENIKSTLASQGYVLIKDPQGQPLQISPLYQTDIEQNNSSNPSRYEFLKATNGDKTLRLTINRNAIVPLDCNDVDGYGKPRSTGPDVILYFSFNLPDNN